MSPVLMLLRCSLMRVRNCLDVSAFVVDLLVKLYVYIIMSHDLYHLSHGFVCGPN